MQLAPTPSQQCTDLPPVVFFTISSALVANTMFAGLSTAACASLPHCQRRNAKTQGQHPSGNIYLFVVCIWQATGQDSWLLCQCQAEHAGSTAGALFQRLGCAPLPINHK